MVPPRPQTGRQSFLRLRRRTGYRPADFHFGRNRRNGTSSGRRGRIPAPPLVENPQRKSGRTTFPFRRRSLRGFRPPARRIRREGGLLEPTLLARRDREGRRNQGISERERRFGCPFRRFAALETLGNPKSRRLALQGFHSVLPQRLFGLFRPAQTASAPSPSGLERGFRFIGAVGFAGFAKGKSMGGEAGKKLGSGRGSRFEKIGRLRSTRFGKLRNGSEFSFGEQGFGVVSAFAFRRDLPPQGLVGQRILSARRKRTPRFGDARERSRPLPQRIGLEGVFPLPALPFPFPSRKKPQPENSTNFLGKGEKAKIWKSGGGDGRGCRWWMPE